MEDYNKTTKFERGSEEERLHEIAELRIRNPKLTYAQAEARVNEMMIKWQNRRDNVNRLNTMLRTGTVAPPTANPRITRPEVGDTRVVQEGGKTKRQSILYIDSDGEGVYIDDDPEDCKPAPRRFSPKSQLKANPTLSYPESLLTLVGNDINAVPFTYYNISQMTTSPLEVTVMINQVFSTSATCDLTLSLNGDTILAETLDLGTGSSVYTFYTDPVSLAHLDVWLPTWDSTNWTSTPGLSVAIKYIKNIPPTNVIIANTGPIWTSTIKPGVEPTFTTMSMVMAVVKVGPEHIPEWQALTLLNGQVVAAKDNVKKTAVNRLKTEIERRIGRPVATVIQVSSFGEMEAKSHNKAMHSINGNTAPPVKVPTRSANPKQLTKPQPQKKLNDIAQMVKTASEFIADMNKDEKVTVISEIPGYQPFNPTIEIDDEVQGKRELPIEELLKIFGGYIGDSKFVYRHEMEMVCVVLNCTELEVEWAIQTLLEMEEMLATENELTEPQEPVPAAVSKATTNHVVKDNKLYSITKEPVGRASKQEPEPKELPREQKAQTAKIDRAKNYNASIKRIAKALGSSPKTSLWFLRSHATRDFKAKVATEIWGNTWLAPEVDTIQWIAFCVCKNISRFTLITTLLELIPQYVELLDDTKIESTLSELLSSTWVDTQRIRAQEQASHNKQVHALNGNTSLSRTMQDVYDAKTESEMMSEKKDGLKQLKGSSVFTRFAAIPSDIMPAVQTLYENTALRGSTISAANAITPNQSLTFPTTTLIPREVRPAAPGVLVNSTVRLPVRAVRTVQWKVNDMAQTDLGKTVEQITINGNTSTIKAETTTLGGFNMFDVVSLSRKKAFYGFSLDQLSLKYNLLHNIYSWENGANNMPWSDPGMLDQRTIPQVITPTVSFNNSPVFGEDCGGITSLFPYLNIAGTIAFHMTEKTVPQGEKENIVYFPPGLFGADNDYESIALFVRGWAAYPADMRTVTIQTTDTAGANQQGQIYIPIATTISIPGMTTIHVILPRNINTRNPRQVAEAAAMAQIIPHSGPNATTNIGPTVPLVINAVGIALTSYNLCEYLATWTVTHDATSLTNYLNRLSLLTGVKDSLCRMREVADLVGVGFPLLPAGNNAASTVFPFDTLQANSYTDWNARRMTQSAANWPLAGPPAGDVVIQQCDVVAWNQITVGLMASPTIDEFGTQLPEEFNRPEATIWQHMRALTFGSVMDVHRHCLGWNAETWDTAYTNTALNCYRTHIKGYFSPSATPMSVRRNARWGPMLVSLFEACTGATVAKCKSGNYTTTIFDSRTPGNNLYDTVVDPATGNSEQGYVPVILPDIWKNILLSRVPREQMALPPPSGNSGIQGFSKGLRAIRIAANQAGSFIEPDFFLVGDTTQSFRSIGPETKWNDRLMFLGTAARSTRNTGVVDALAPAANTWPLMRRPFQPAWTSAFPATNEYSWNTCCMPTVNSTGQYLHAITTQAAALPITRAQLGKQIFNWAAWQVAEVSANNDIADSPDIQVTSPYDKFQAVEGKVEEVQE